MSLVYWAGRRTGQAAFVTTCVAPAARTTRGSFETSSESNANVVMFLAANDLELIAQVHSHPQVSVDHSPGDDERALMPFEGLVSIIVPHYARRGMTPLTICGVHIFENGAFRRLGDVDVESRLSIIPSLADLRNS